MMYAMRKHTATVEYVKISFNIHEYIIA